MRSILSDAKNGDTVKVHYKGTLQDDSVFDSSEGRDPLQFTMGQGQLIPGFEKAVATLKVGESTQVDIPSAEAYGKVNEDLIVNIPRNQLPESIDPKVGMQLQMNQQNGQPIPVRVTAVSDSELTIDANHPLAGKDLTFQIELVEVVSA